MRYCFVDLPMLISLTILNIDGNLEKGEILSIASENVIGISIWENKLSLSCYIEQDMLYCYVELVCNL